MSLNILIINENDSFCSFISGLLTSDGHVTLCSKGDREALKVVTIWRPDLIVLEACRPEIGVVDTMQRLQRLEATRFIPIIVISDCPEFEFELLQAFDFIHKPVDLNRLREDIELVRKGRRKKARQARREHLDEEELSQFTDFLVTHSGLNFERRNLKPLERGVLNRMAALCIGTCNEYFEYLKKNRESRQELQKLLHFLTVGETFFFRYHAHFEALQRFLTVEHANTRQKLRVWSAGCSTGEEPYSLAMTIMEALPDWQKRDIRIIATDINNRALKRAGEGVYGRWAMRVMEKRYLDRYFERVGESYLLHDEVKGLVKFSHLNLQADPYLGEGEDKFDVIFCRNVLIYFSHATVKKVVERMAESLKPGGLLFLGHSETLSQISALFERQVYEGSFYYRKKNGTVQPPRIVVRAARERRIPEVLLPVAPPRLKPSARPEPVPPPATVREQPAERYEKALTLFEAEQYTEAGAIIEEILRENPSHERALVLRGFVLANNGGFDEALGCCDRALAFNDLLPEAYFLKGLILDMIEKPLEAINEYRKAILLKMDFVMPHYHLGRLFIRLGKVREGIRELRNSLRILEKGDKETLVPYSGGLSREVFLCQLRGELGQVHAA